MTTTEAPKPLVEAAPADLPRPLIRAGCYLRISSDPKDKREGVDRQRQDTTALCEVKGWTPVRFYEDNDRSASSGREREHWQRLLADITADKIDAIAAWDQDRNWRMMHELEDLRKFFTSLGRKVPLATTGQGDIDLYSPTGVMMAQIKTAVSEHEIAMMKVRQRRAARQKAEQGKPKWRKAFGYIPEIRRKEDDDGTRTADPATKDLVADAYKAILTGEKSITKIADDWNEAGVYGLTGKPWSTSTVSLFLRAPRNAGLRAHNDEIVGKGTWTPLVSESVWRAVQAKLNAPGRAPGRKSVRKHLLTGVLWCGREGCEGYLSGYWVMQKTGGKPGRPRANQEKEPHSGQVAHSISYGCKSCRGVSVRAEQIEPLLYRLVGNRLAMPDAVDLLKARILDDAEAEAIGADLNLLYGEVEQIGVERGQRLLTGQQAKIATDLINVEIAKLKRREQDQERLRVFDGIPLGTPEAAAAVERLLPDRFRAVIAMVMTPTVMPVGKGSHVFNPDRLNPNWHD